MSASARAAVVFSVSNKPIIGAICVLNPNAGTAPTYWGVTNGDGYVVWQGVPDDLTTTALYVWADGFKLYSQSLTLHGGNMTVRVGGTTSDPQDVILPALQPFKRPSSLPRLVVRGQFFSLSAGEYFTAIECSDFNLYARFLDGEDITPILKQRSEVGFNMLRVWTLFDLAQFGIGRLMLQEHPDLYDRLSEFCGLCDSYGLYVEFTAYTGINDPFHWDLLTSSLLKGEAKNVICELVNEDDQNHEPDFLGRVLDVTQFQPVTGILCAHGSNGSEHIPVRPAWDYETFHTNDAFEWQRKVGHNAMELGSKPVLSNENTRFDNDRSVIHAHDAALGAALLCAGSCCHTPSGKNSTLWVGDELAWALQWATGAHEMTLKFQDGAYRHAPELEGSGDLRVYQRVLDIGAFTAEIRA